MQCECGDQNGELIACSRYSIQRELKHLIGEKGNAKIHVVFLIQLPGIAADAFTGFQVHVLILEEVLSKCQGHYITST